MMTIQIKAASRLVAAYADEKQAKKFLNSLGFVLNSNGADSRNGKIYWDFKKWDKNKMIEKLGHPKGALKGYVWDIPGKGSIYVMDNRQIVCLTDVNFNSL